MIKYNPLFTYMQKNDISGYRLIKQGFNHATWQNIRSSKNITTKTLNKLCLLLDCDVEDVISYVETKEDIRIKKYMKYMEKK